MPDETKGDHQPRCMHLFCRLFRLSDGESLVQNAPNGERNVSTCHYLDADSAMIDGKKWNLLEFAKEMEKRGIMIAPMELCQVPERG